MRVLSTLTPGTRVVGREPRVRPCGHGGRHGLGHRAGRPGGESARGARDEARGRGVESVGLSGAASEHRVLLGVWWVVLS